VAVENEHELPGKVLEVSTEVLTEMLSNSFLSLFFLSPSPSSLNYVQQEVNIAFDLVDLGLSTFCIVLGGIG
jgi:hypothetical protein